MKRKFSTFCKDASAIAVFNPLPLVPASRSASVSPLLPNASASLVPLFPAPSDGDHHVTSPAPPTSLQTRNNWVYETALLNHRHLTTTLSWYTTPTGRRQLLVGLHVIGGDDPLSLFKYNVCINPSVPEQNRGQELTQYESSQIAVFWDFSRVKYDTGLEPVDGFFLLVLVDSQAAFLLGDVPEQCSTVFQALGFTLVSQAECALSCKNGRLHGIEARLTGKGPFKDVLIQCRGMETEDLEKCTVLYVHIGKELVLKVRKLHWNFRGMQTKVLADGLEVEIAWDVQAWLFREEKSDAKGKKNPPEFATFAFMTQHGSSIFHC
ncbi:uncharacterized protein LOC115735400 [Rhodamnia argentea]|uniref:Uncharacterized protein LOC115735400 n=1 Tax=Rhodamnia argentea TaxID=178133 RepID=A0A8B8NK50_9MYRT|nr:uncharacterized protein LOC115735400 [Rhodamnia argentea]